MKLNVCRVTYLTGMTGVAIILLTTMAAAFAFDGPDGAAYSLLNRKISTLGNPKYSGLSLLFNWGLIAGGVLIAAFVVGLGLYVGQRAMLFVVLTGIVTASGVVLVGICPVTQPQCHRLAGQTVFLGGSMTVLLFTAFLLYIDQDKVPKWLAAPSALACMVFVLSIPILYVRYENPLHVFITGPIAESRPYLWLPSFLEWLIFFAIIGWILTLAFTLYWQERAEMLVYPRFQPHQIDQLP